MNNLNIGFLASSVLAATGLGIYAYMTNTEDKSEHVNNEISHDHEEGEEDESDYIKSNKKSINVKTKRRLNKASGTRRKR